MRIFITGATGYIGGAVVSALRNAGHEVAALVRPDAEQGHLREQGVFIIAGDLASLADMGDTLKEYDAFVHTAQSNENAAELNAIAIDAFTAQEGHFVFTSGVWVLGNTKGSDEASPVNPLEIVAWRPSQEERALGAGGAVIRPGCVYGGKQSLLADWFAAAEQGRATKIVGDGNNRWALVDLDDLAQLYVRAVEQRATGVLHGIDDTNATLNECARAVSPDLEIEYVPLEVARENFGPFADALAIDQVVHSNETRAKLGWTPRHTFTSSIDEQWREWRDTRR